jgi:DNA-binding LacI/PurR family transcriptional regulator/DNA-binding transcriptional regulator YhcF (GntR family)
MAISRKRKNKTESIADNLRQRIMRRELSPDIPLSPSRELATEFDVSLLTADRAVRILAQEGLLSRFKGKGTFVKARYWRIGYCEDFSAIFQYPQQKLINDVYVSPVVHELRKNHCIVSMISYRNLKSADYCAKVFAGLDALIVNKSLLDSCTLENLYSFEGPILIYRQATVLEDIPFSQVVPDWTGGMDDIFKTADLERIKKYFIFSNTSNNGIARADAFIKQAKKYGVEDSKIEFIKVTVADGQSPQLYGSKFGQKLKPGNDTLVFTTSDLLAFGILDALYDRGLRSGQFELVSCDNLEAYGICPFNEPHLTSIDYPRKRITHRAVKHLINILEDRDDAVSIVKIPTRLVIRKSGLATDG